MQCCDCTYHLVLYGKLHVRCVFVSAVSSSETSKFNTLWKIIGYFSRLTLQRVLLEIAFCKSLIVYFAYLRISNLRIWWDSLCFILLSAAQSDYCCS